VPIERIREVLFRVEQFRSDALVLPQIGINGLGIGATEFMGQTTRTSGSSKSTETEGFVYGAGAKSAGSIGANDNKQKSSRG